MSLNNQDLDPKNESYFNSKKNELFNQMLDLIERRFRPQETAIGPALQSVLDRISGVNDQPPAVGQTLSEENIRRAKEDIARGKSSERPGWIRLWPGLPEEF